MKFLTVNRPSAGQSQIAQRLNCRHGDYVTQTPLFSGRYWRDLCLRPT
jgi:hypothetical protein